MENTILGSNAHFMRKDDDLGRVGDLIGWWDTWMELSNNIDIPKYMPVSVWCNILSDHVKSIKEGATQEEKDDTLEQLQKLKQTYGNCYFV